MTEHLKVEKLPYKSAQPLAAVEQPPRRSVEESLRNFGQVVATKPSRVAWGRRKFSSPGTSESRRVTNRIMGEHDDD